ncbi:transketolase family protein [Adlercreutzia aquisgranensis]|uniref:transketolase family protein n=1 Tax=Adlercreutzia aquisgranensis TaxID=2941323 RepID=UPI00203DB458|nr:transketolase C-terminal domain-containing protein [Adlercreutzia aquisgranensis]
MKEEKLLIPTRTAFGKRLISLANDYDFVVCNADTKTCSLENFGKLYPDREVSFGIAEQNLVNGAVGIALSGRKAVLSTYAVFLSMRACEQVRSYACLTNADVLMVGTHAGLNAGSEGASHSSIEDVAIMRSMPNITIVEPSDRSSAESLAEAALRFKGPLYVRLHYRPIPEVHHSGFEFEIGKVYELFASGSDVCLMVSGALTGMALSAAGRLEELGIYSTVVEIPTIKPIDRDSVLKYAKRCGAVVAIHDHNIIGGLGSAIAEVVSEAYPIPVLRVGIRDSFAHSGSVEENYRANCISIEEIIESSRKAIALKGVSR